MAKTSDGEAARDGVASRTIEPRKYKSRKHHALPGKTLGSSKPALTGFDCQGFEFDF